MSKEISNEEALQNLLLDIDCLDELLPWTGKFNIFDVLKVSRAEIRHSNMLAWLLDPNENHGIGDLFLRLVLQKLIHNDSNGRYNVFQLLLNDNYSFTVYREWKNIDILLISDENKTLIAFENKIASHEHSNQLNRYREILQNDFPAYNQIYVFLTPDGEKPSDIENWDVMTYSTVVELLDLVVQRDGIAPDVLLMLQNYISILRRDIVDDQQLIEICNKIYNKHRKALDLIYENRFNNANLISDTVRGALTKVAEAGTILFAPARKNNVYVQFHSPVMDKIFPPLENDISSYSTNRVYTYFVYIKDTTLTAYFELGGWNVPAEHQKMMDAIVERYKPKDKTKEGFRYKRIFKTKSYVIDEENMEDSIYEITDQLIRELLNSEQQLAAYLSKQT